MNRARLVQSIKAHEGYKPLYQDSRGLWTAGFGHLVHHMSLRDAAGQFATLGELLDHIANREQHDRWFEADVTAAINLATEWLGATWHKLTDERREVVAEMCFQLGGRIFQFRQFRAALVAGDYRAARAEMLDSRWREQTPARVMTLARRMFSD